MTNISDFTMSKHAMSRILDMAVNPELVRRALTEPERIVRCTSRPNYDLYHAGNITVSVARDSLVVATVLWRYNSDWCKDMELYGKYEGREYRPKCPL